MRRVRYAVAVSLDGYIAGPNGEADWIIMDPAIDFNSFLQQFDTVLWDAGPSNLWRAPAVSQCPAWRLSYSREPCGKVIIQT